MGDLNWVTVLVSAGVSLSGLGAGGVLVNLYKTWRDNRKQDRGDAIGEWKELNTMKDARIAVVEAKIEAAELREHDCQLKYERLVAYVQYLTGIIEEKTGTKPRPFDPTGSAFHSALPGVQ
jgi:hypothetical protein